jgi:predicted DNA-binding transcriptional regulator AlpA
MSVKTKKRKPTKVVELPPGIETLLTINQVAAAMGITRQTLRIRRQAGKFPKPDDTGVTGTRPKWRLSTVNEYLANPKKGK